MSARRTDNEPGPEDTLDLQAFRQVSPQPGPPLEQLGAALSERLTQGDDPYAPLSAAEPPEAATPGELAAALVANAINEPAAPDPACEITPRTIFEAMLFVGSPDNQPLTSRQVAELMRGVRPAEIDELVGKLNADYEARNCPYRIVSEGTGYRLALADEFAALREQLYGKGRLARLSRAAVEVLAAVAYRPGITADEIHRLRGVPSGPILLQLVRRQLVRPERSREVSSRIVRYHTTERFLKLFGLATLDELPREGELDKA